MDQRAAGLARGANNSHHGGGGNDSRRHLWSSAPLVLPATLDRGRPPADDRGRHTRSAQHDRRGEHQPLDRIFGRDRSQDAHWRQSSVPNGHGHGPAQHGQTQPMPAIGRDRDGRGRPLAKEQGGNPRALSCGSDAIHSRGKGYAGTQDRSVHRKDVAGLFAGVFDGHGHHGDKVAEFSKEAVCREVFARAGRQPGTEAMNAAFEVTQKQLMDNKQFAQYSGSTACTAFFPEGSKEVIIANCGDSRAVLARRDARGGSKLQAVELSRDHTPSCPREKRRIQALSGRISRSLVPVRRSMGGEVGLVPMGPERVWDNSGTCGLGVSRSLGDLHMHPYVSGKPEIMASKLCDDDRMVILGSDGVWNHLTNQQAVDIASKHSCPTKAAQAISQAARTRWAAETGGQLWDDITTVIVHLPNQGRPHTGDSRAGSEPGRPSSQPRAVDRLPPAERQRGRPAVRSYGR